MPEYKAPQTVAAANPLCHMWTALIGKRFFSTF
jgi:hypothetical protein